MFNQFNNYLKEVGKALIELKSSHLFTIFSMGAACIAAGWTLSHVYETAFGEKKMRLIDVQKDYVAVKDIRNKYIKEEIVRREYVARSRYLELLNSKKDSENALKNGLRKSEIIIEELKRNFEGKKREASILIKEINEARNEIASLKDTKTELKIDLKKSEKIIEQLKTNFEDTQKKLEAREKAEILGEQIGFIQNTVDNVENDIEYVEDEIKSLRAKAAFYKKDYEVNGRKLLPNSEKIMITEEMLRYLENPVSHTVVGPDPRKQTTYHREPTAYERNLLQLIKEKDLKIGDMIEIVEPGPRQDNITAAAKYKAEADALEKTRQRLLDKLESLREQIRGLISATRND